MFVVSKDYMDNATHYVRMHGYSQISEGGSCDDVIDVIRRHGIWYMSRDYMTLNTTYIFLNRNALPKPLARAVRGR